MTKPTELVAGRRFPASARSTPSTSRTYLEQANAGMSHATLATALGTPAPGASAASAIAPGATASAPGASAPPATAPGATASAPGATAAYPTTAVPAQAEPTRPTRARASAPTTAGGTMSTSTPIPHPPIPAGVEATDDAQNHESTGRPHLELVGEQAQPKDQAHPPECPATPATVRPPLPDAHAWGSRLAQAVAEVLAGDRPLSQMVRWTDAKVYTDLHRRVRMLGMTTTATARGAKERSALRSVHVCNPADQVAEVAAHIRYGNRSRAVALRLEVHRGRWICTALELG